MNDPITLFGVVAVAVMLIAYTLEERAPVWVLVFAAGCLASGVYALLAGAWPYAVAELIWTVVALRRWRRRVRPRPVAEGGLR
ncbi:hypothetical protein KBY88_03800 [Cyanobium sp. Morenito 9A2]|nr:hypothetical protein [Cyanobium sp. Morenito 9A2]